MEVRLRVAAVSAAGRGRLGAPRGLLKLLSVGDGQRRLGRAVRTGRNGCGGVQVVESVAQMGHEPSAQGDIDARNGSQSDRHFASALSESGAEAVGADDGVGGQSALAAQLVKVTDGELENVGLFEFGHVVAVLGGQGGGHKILELVEAPVDPGASLSFQQRLGNLLKRKKKKQVR